MQDDPKCADCDFTRSQHETSGEEYRLNLECGMCQNYATESSNEGDE